MNIRPIKTGADHERALEEVSALIERNPPADSDDADRLEVLGTLIAQYEDTHFPIENPSPVEAIEFRMDQLGLKRKDLIPYIGSASKVSEVLSGKRTLSRSMIRALRDNLGIPADVLISDSESSISEPNAAVQAYPLKQMCKLGYFGRGKSYSSIVKNAQTALDSLFSAAKVDQTSAAYCRSTHYRDGKQLNKLALRAWQARVIIKSFDRKVADYRSGTVNKEFLEEIAQLSVLDSGPQVAREMLEKHGIPIVVERHLDHTYLDGACFLRSDNVPVIGITTRHDKLDNFWFTLMHELVHVGRHLGLENTSFFDDLDEPGTDEKEKEADHLAAEALIPSSIWHESKMASSEDWRQVIVFAESIRRHPAVVAGRIQRETKNYRRFSTLIGRHTVRSAFGVK